MHTNPAFRKRSAKAVTVLSLLSFLLSGLGPTWLLSPALAANPLGKKRVLVVKTQRAPDVPTIVLTRVSGYFDTILGMDDKIEVVTAAGLAPDIKPSVPTTNPNDKLASSVERGSIDRADEAAKQATTLTQKKRWNDAVKAWTKAITLYDKAIAWLDDPSRYAAALAGRAYAYFGAGYDDNGEGDLGRAFAIDPELVIDEKLAPKNAVTVANRVRARVKPAGLQLKVTANAPRAVVFVNGKNRGAAPLTIGDLPLGDHLVRVLAEGHDPFGQVATLIDTSVEVNATLTPRPGAPGPTVPEVGTTSKDAETGLESFAATGEFGTSFQAAAARIAKNNRLDAVVMSYVRKNQGDYDLGVFVWENGKVSEVPTARIAGDLSALQVTVLESIEKASSYLGAAPADRLVSGRPAIYGAVAVAKVDPPKVDPPKTDVAKVDPPKVDPPKVDPPKTDVAKVDPPKVDPPKTDVAKVDPPKTDLKREDPKKPIDITNYEVQPLRPKTPPVIVDPIEKDDDAFYETWWFWTIVGGLAAGSAAVIATSVGGSDGPGGFRATVTW